MTRTTLPFPRILNLSVSRPKSEGIPGAQAFPTPGASPLEDDRGPLNETERDGILEIALLMATANGATSPDELASLADLVAHLRGRRPAPGELGTIMNAIHARDVSASVEERVRVVAATMPRKLARELAYKAAYAIRVADLESNPDEEELGEILVETLGLVELAPELEGEVNEALVAE